jgi:long-subunit fatty acid transport protein
MPRNNVFVATSLNTCTYELTEGEDNRFGVSAGWKYKPNDNDVAEFHSHIRGKITKAGEEAPDIQYALQGNTHRGGLQRSVESVKRFLETGDPGVPTKK